MAKARISVPINPYIAGQPLRSKDGFFGRQDIINEIARELGGSYTGKSFVLFGQRRIGKTSLLFQLERLLLRKSFLPVYFNLQDSARLPLGEVLTALARKIMTVANLPEDKAITVDDRGNLFLYDFLPHLYKKLRRNRRLVLLFDEFDTLDQIGGFQLAENIAANSFRRFLRQLAEEDRELRLSYVLVVGRQAEDLNIDFKADLKASLVKQIWTLDRESAEKLIRQAEDNGTLKFSHTAIKRIIELTNCHPYVLQLLCHTIWHIAHSTDDKSKLFVKLADVNNALPKSLEAGDQALDWLWGGLSPEEKIYAAVLSELAHENEVIAEKRVLDALATYAPRLHTPEIESASRYLVKRHILEEADTHSYRFAVELFRRWIKQKKPISDVKTEIDQIDPLAESLFKTGQEFYRHRKLELAVKNYRDALQTNHRHFGARLQLGKTLLELNNTDEAVSELQRAYELDPEDAQFTLGEALKAQARIRKEAGDLKEALAIINQASKVVPDDREMKNLRTVVVAGNVITADFVGRDQINITYGYAAKDIERLIEKVLSFLQAGATFVPTGEQGDLLLAEHDGETLTLRPGAVTHLANSRNERRYLLALTLNRDYQIWATRFIPLAARMDVERTVQGLDLPLAYSEFRLPPPGAGTETQPTIVPLADITEALGKHTAFVILGEPGAGKTTALKKIAFEAARTLLLGGEARVPLFVRLSQQRGRSPFDFLKAEWERRTGIDFADALATGRVLVLADGVNELPRDDRDERLKDWRLFVYDYAGANQILFTSRAQEYEGQLNVPRVIVEPLDDARIADYLKHNQAESLSELLADPETRLGDMARNPFNLSLLTFASKANQHEMANKGRLLEWFVGELFAREERQAHKGWLPRDVQTRALAQLAYTMQMQGESTSFPLKAAKAALPKTVRIGNDEIKVKPAELFRFARAVTILDPATWPDVRFYHSLLQEYFAALELLRRFEENENLSPLWKCARLVEEMPSANVDEWEPLPEPPTSGWEIATILACGLTPNPARFIDAVRSHNPVLAGRCLEESGLAKPAPVTQRVRSNLLQELHNPMVHLRARLQSGFTLGRIGDPRFETQTVNGVKVVLPTLINVPAGIYIIGSPDDDPDVYDDETPRHMVDLSTFKIGKWPITNIEFACFIEAGGYEDERWWVTDAARRWLRGEETMEGQFAEWLTLLKALKANANWREQLELTGSYSPDQIEAFKYIATLSEDEFKVSLTSGLSVKSRVRPQFWDERTYNNPSQPIVGITCFEACAYCVWLSSLTGHPYRLPTEVEWEASARGMDGRIYPWGNLWDMMRTNTIEGRVLKPSPVGAYTADGGVGPFGGEDQSGNVWNWTSTLYRPYPYVAEDGREDIEAEGERVVRGGSWKHFKGNARCMTRAGYPPTAYDVSLGFRIALSAPSL
jgi:formylglycine-generating enzyme required for sulfatase activity/tetratricopeptide (TPR) repeat protein